MPAAPSHPFRCKTKTNCKWFTHVFWRLAIDYSAKSCDWFSTTVDCPRDNWLEWFLNIYFRSDEKLRELFAKSSLTVIKDEVQKNFPGELYRVKMYVTFLDLLWWLLLGYAALYDKGISEDVTNVVNLHLKFFILHVTLNWEGIGSKHIFLYMVLWIMMVFFGYLMEAHVFSVKYM